MELAKGARLSVGVVEVTPNFEKIPNSDKNCHLTIFQTDDGAEYRGQMCTNATSVPYKVGDNIHIAIRAFTKGIYTFDLERVIPGESSVDTSKMKISDLTPPHLNVNATPGAIALMAAVQHNQNRVNKTAEDIIRDADIFAEFLRNNTF